MNTTIEKLIEEIKELRKVLIATEIRLEDLLDAESENDLNSLENQSSEC